MKIDSHHHFWDYSAEEYGWISDQMRVLRRDFGPTDLKPLIEKAGIDGVVSVQARQSLEETRWLIDLAARNQFVRGVVGWLPLASAEINDVLNQFQGSDWLKGVRHVIQDEADDDFILRRDFGRGVGYLHDHGLVYDILIYGRHLANTITFVDEHPNQIFVLDHIAKPTITAREFDDEWARQLRELARRENVVCKFSGVVTEVRDEEWTLETIRPYWEVALDAFGAGRLMFGSDWPVILLKSEYARWVEAVEQLSEPLSATEQAAFWGDNAVRVYQLT